MSDIADLVTVADILTSDAQVADAEALAVADVVADFLAGSGAGRGEVHLT